MSQSQMILPATGAATLRVWEDLLDQATELVSASRAENTRRAYASRWSRFQSWCRERGVSSLPAEPAVVVLHLTWLASQGRSRSTLAQTAAAIGNEHSEHGFENPSAHPAVRRLLMGHRRSTRDRRERRATPILLPDLLKMVETCDTETLCGLRDASLLLVTWCCGLRRSEAAALDVADIQRQSHQTAVTVRWSKSDQEGRGETMVLPRGTEVTARAARALDAWIAAADMVDGPLWCRVDRWQRARPGARLSGEAVSDVVTRTARLGGICYHPEGEPCGHQFSGHSLRAGLATSLDLAGVDARSIERMLRHRTPGMANRYLRRERDFRGTIVSALG